MSLSDRLSQARRGRELDVTSIEPEPSRAPTRRRSVDPYAGIKRSVHAALVESLGPQLYHTQLSEADMHMRVRTVLHDVLSRDQTPLPAAERATLAQQIADEILGYGPLEPLLRDPDVTVEIDRYRPVFVMGEVGAAGQYSYVPGMTVQKAIAAAGGFSARAQQRDVDITRSVNGKVMTGRVVTSDPLLPGDTVYVRERLF